VIEQNVKGTPWQRIVAELNTPSPDDRAFLGKLVNVLWQVAGARQAVLYVVEGDEGAGGEPRPILVWPQPQAKDPTAGIESPAEQRAAARAAVEAGGLQIQQSEGGGGAYYGDAERGSIMALPIEASQSDQGVAPRLAVTLLLEPRSRQALQTTAALVEVLTGYTHLHTSRQQLRRTKAASAALDLAARLIASINTARGFKGAAMQLVNDLSRQAHADRAALGWVRDIGVSSGEVRVVALTDTEHVDARMAMVQKLQAAMDECLDQEQPVMYPPPPAVADGPGSPADVLLSQAITHAHRELAASDARLRVASFPLRVEDKVVGVLTMEMVSEAPIDVGAIELLQAALDLVAPVLVVRRSDDRLVATRAWASMIRGGQWFVGPKHTVWKMVSLLALVGFVLLVFVQMPYRVEAIAEIQPRTRHIVSVPFDGVVLSVPEGIEAGRIVQQGELLVQMDTEEILFRLLEARSQKEQLETEAEMHRRQAKQGEAQQAEQRARGAEARMRLAERQLAQARLAAPITGTIIAGDLRERIGASVKLGDPLFQIAPLEDMKVIARVSDRDIALIRDERAEKGTTVGEIATKAFPSVGFPFVVERIVPLAQPKDGKNTFEVHGRLESSAPWLKPGMEGLARLDTGRHSLLYIGTRRIRDQLRLWLWW
jgi:biotin carboxyl carrier protein